MEGRIKKETTQPQRLTLLALLGLRGGFRFVVLARAITAQLVTLSKQLVKSCLIVGLDRIFNDGRNIFGHRNASIITNEPKHSHQVAIKANCARGSFLCHEHHSILHAIPSNPDICKLYNKNQVARFDYQNEMKTKSCYLKLDTNFSYGILPLPPNSSRRTPMKMTS